MRVGRCLLVKCEHDSYLSEDSKSNGHLQPSCLLAFSLSLRCPAHGPLAKCLMHVVHLSGNTSGVSKSLSDWLNYTGFPGDLCVAFFNVLPGNKDAVTPNSLTKEESRRVYKCTNVTLSETNCDWLFDMSVKRTHGWTLANEMQPSVPRGGLSNLGDLSKFQVQGPNTITICSFMPNPYLANYHYSYNYYIL